MKTDAKVSNAAQCSPRYQQNHWTSVVCICAAPLMVFANATGHTAVGTPALSLRPASTGAQPAALAPAGQLEPDALKSAGAIKADALTLAGSPDTVPLWVPDAQDRELKTTIAKLKISANRTLRRGSMAEKQAARAAWWLGLLSLHGIGMGTDRAAAQRWFERSQAMGERWASAGLAWCEIDGCRGPPSPSSARVWIKQLAPVDPGRALFLEWLAVDRLSPLQVARPVNLGNPMGPSVQVQSDLLLRAARAGNAGALNELALQSTAAGQFTEALKNFYAAADRSPAAAANAKLLAARVPTISQEKPSPGTPEGWFNEAQRYHRGDGVPANYAEAIRLYQIAASGGSKPAKRMLEMIYSRPAPNGAIDIGWMQQLAYLEISEERAVLSVLPAHSPRLFARDPTPLYDLVPLQWRAAKETLQR